MIERVSVVCRGMRDGPNGPVICKGWGRWGTPDERCPACGQRVAVMQTVAVVPLRDDPDDGTPFDPDWCMCPGDAIRRFVEGDGDDRPVLPSHHITRTMLNLDADEYADLLCGRRPLSDDGADVLGRTMGVSHGAPDSFWRNYERIYRDALARGKTHVCHPDVTAAT